MENRPTVATGICAQNLLTHSFKNVGVTLDSIFSEDQMDCGLKLTDKLVLIKIGNQSDANITFCEFIE